MIDADAHYPELKPAPPKVLPYVHESPETFRTRGIGYPLVEFTADSRMLGQRCVLVHIPGGDDPCTVSHFKVDGIDCWIYQSDVHHPIGTWYVWGGLQERYHAGFRPSDLGLAVLRKLELDDALTWRNEELDRMYATRQDAIVAPPSV